MIDRQIFFDKVRSNPFPGKLNQSQVDGMSAILSAFEHGYAIWDLRWLAYAFATTMWETSSEMQPIEEYGKGSGQPYGVADKETGQTYYGRGYVQLTWRDNYKKADQKLDLKDQLSCEWHAVNALNPPIASRIMFRGMEEGWFRSGQTLPRYFSDTVDDPFGAREIINGDKNKVPSWASGAKVGDLIAGYHKGFLSALQAAYTGDAPEVPTVNIIIQKPAGVEVAVQIEEADDGESGGA